MPVVKVGPPDAASGPILVLSAFDPELAPLRLALAGGALSSAEVVCAAAGIGAVDAGIGATREITARAPRLVLFLGTAGGYGAAAATPVGAVVVGRRILLASTAAVRGDGYLPGPMSVAVTTDSALRKALVRSSRQAPPLVGDVATTLAITRTVTLARRLAGTTGAVVENLEAFAVARAAAAARLPFAALLGVSNRVGPRAHEQWLRHAALATRAASRVIENYLLAARSVTAPIRSAGARRQRIRRR